MLRQSSRRTVFAIGTAIAIAMAGPAVGSATAAEITLKASKKEIRLGKSTGLSGTLSDVFNGANGDRTVTLHATPYPYNSEQVVTTTTTDQDGDFSFGKVETELNTRYRATFEGTVLEGSAESAERQVFVFPRTSFDLTVTKRGFAKARFEFRYSPLVQPEYYVGRKDVNWYFRKTSQKKLRRIDRTRFKDTARGVSGKLRYRLPRSRKGYRFQVNVCVDAPAADIGIGNDKPLACPESFSARVPASAEAPDPRSARARP